MVCFYQAAWARPLTTRPCPLLAESCHRSLGDRPRMKPDIKLSIRFKTTAKGGRSRSVAPRIVPFYACPLGIHGHLFDCRILLTETLELGKSYFVDVALLNPSLALPHIQVGDLVQLREGKVVAEGFVEEIY